MDPLALLPPGTLPIFAGAIVLGLVHGAEPGHGWPIAATYALDRERKWVHGLVASVLLGLGHLVSSLAVVAAFFLAKRALDLEQLNEPYVIGDVAIGGPVGIVAGVLLVALGVREYRRGGHGHDHGHDHDLGHSHDAHDHEHQHETESPGLVASLRSRLPFVGSLGHDHPTAGDLDRTGLAGLVWTAFVLGFVHEEEFEIIGLCLGSSVCLELMLVYAIAVMVALVGLTLLLIAGYYRYEERMERYAEHFPTISAAVLVVMGLGFVLGLF
jgi:ABC-type nickel/cobalt efflux system permease component RcnA